jgi:hypothetical protein
MTTTTGRTEAMSIEYRTPEGDVISEYEATERYRAFLDDVYEDVSICGLTYAPARALEAVDPIAYRVGFSDWTDAEGYDEI